MSYPNLQKLFTFKASLKFISCSGLVVLADVLFFQKPLGWTLGLFGMVLLLLVRCHTRPAKRHLATDIAAFSTLGLALALIEMPTFGITFLYSFSIIATALLPKLPPLNDARILAGCLLRYLWRGWFRILGDSLRLTCVIQRLHKRQGKQRSFLRHWLVPSVMSGVFIVLFALANPILDQWLSTIQFMWVIDHLSFSRILFASIIAAGSWALIRPKFKRHKKPAAASGSVIAKPSTTTSLLFNERSIRTSLILFNGLFLLQNLMDIAFLWSGAALPEGMTYAQYAHQGAYPLIVTALLAGAFVLIALKPGSMTERLPIIRKLVFAWVGQNILLVFSSIVRTLGYIDEYSLTYLRVAALIWMVLVALGLFLIIARIHFGKTNLWLINGNSIALAATLYLCCFVNFGGMIAWHNVTHAIQDNASLDIYYLRSSVGVEAIPALRWFEQHAYESTAVNAAYQARQSLETDITTSMQDWHRWTFREYRISRAIASPVTHY